jgi:hypothetical protein
MSGFDWMENHKFEEEIDDIPYFKGRDKAKPSIVGKMYTLKGDRYNKWIVQSQHANLDKLTLVNYMDKNETIEMWGSEFYRDATEVIF